MRLRETLAGNGPGIADEPRDGASRRYVTALGLS
jgi:hypothetical protein